MMKTIAEELILVVTLLLVAAVVALAAPPPCPPGKLIKLSEAERRIRIEQWSDAIDHLPEDVRPGRRVLLRNETGLTDDDIANCRKGVKKPKPFDVTP